MARRVRITAGTAAVLLLALVGGPVGAETQATSSRGAEAVDAPRTARAAAAWEWPLAAARIVRPFVAPAHAYGPGHRGIDLIGAGPVRAPADGVVAFRGMVAERGVVTIDHGVGLVSTLEPVRDGPPAGTVVRRGDEIGAVDAGGHAAPGTLHLGVRRDGEYINPLLLLGGLPRAVLLPCC